jgi:alpha-L-fucosidase
VSATDTAPSHRFAGRPLPQWYDDAKFGIFIHWGPYAVPCFAPVDHDMGAMMKSGDWQQVFKCSPYTEWYLNSWSLEGSDTAAHHDSYYGPQVTYQDFVDEFRERSVGADHGVWADLFAAAGARYVVPVSKHHDGFLMWPSRTPNPHRQHWHSDRDHIGELAAAVRQRGMRFGVYYSGGLDWTFTPPPIRDFAGMIGNIPQMPEYAEYITAHVDELVDTLQPSVLWNDIAWPFALDPADTIGRYYDRVPDGVVNDRFNMLAVGAGQLHADFATPEYSTEANAARKWEVCRGIGRSFGYNRMEHDGTMPTVDELVWMVADIVGRGGNLLLNVGPSADGQIPIAQVTRLLALGWWLRVNGDAIYGTRAGGVGTTGDGHDVRFTEADGVRYAIVRGAPHGEVELQGVQVGDGAEVTMLGSPRVLRHRSVDGGVRVQLPDHLPASPATVLALRG